MTASFAVHLTTSLHAGMYYPPDTVPSGAMAIPLSRGLYALADQADSGLLSRYTWHASPGGRSLQMRALTSVPNPPGSRSRHSPLFMHTLITGFGLTRHLNGNLLDNRRVNLHELTASARSAGIKLPSGNSSGFKGVSEHKEKWWRAELRHDYLGIYPTAVQAALAYDHAAVIEFGQDARTNEDMGLVAHDSCDGCPCQDRRAA